VSGRVSMTLPQSHRGECSVDGRKLHLTPQETVLLEALLVRGPDRPMPLAEIIEVLWSNPNREPDSAIKVVQVYISRLRAIGVQIIGRNGFGYTIPRDGRSPNLYAIRPQRLAA
jgi:DNA-binding response OmpR family regulator